jgi:hypothetical protein
MKVSPIQSSFNAGEFSELVSAQVRFEKYKNAVSLAENMIPIVQGGMTRRTGTMYVAETADALYVADDYVVDGYAQSSGKSRLVPFEYSITQAYILEFGEANIRFYKDRGQIISGISPYSIVSPYSYVDLFDLKFTQSADVLYITHPDYAPRKLTRTGHTSWTLSIIDFLDGPYLPTNSGTTTITLGATTGTTSATASAALFDSTDIGRFIRFKSTGSTWGWMEITAFTSSTVVTVSIQRSPAAATASTDWRLGLWSETTGYPSCVAFFEDRLFFAGGSYRPQRIDGSIVGDYENFAPSASDGVVADDNAISASLNANDVNVIRWMIDDEKGLLVGTVSGEWMVRPSSLSEAMTPTNISAKRSTAFGSANLQAIRTGKASIYVQRAGRKARELAYVYEVDGFRSPDMTVLAEHILEGGVTQFDYQQEPFSVVWFVRADGQLIGLTYERDQDVLGWHRHIIGGHINGGDAEVESVAVIPTPAGDADELWLIVRREIDGVSKRYIEYVTPKFDDDDTTYAHFLDCGLEYDGVPVTEITGMDHLEGETVSILADGASHPDVVVSVGKVTLVRSASVVHIGLSYESNIKTLRIEAGAADGTAQGKTKRIHRVNARLYKTLGLKFGPNATNLDILPFRTSADAMGNPPELFTGDKTINWNSGYETEGQMYFRQDQPLPFTLLGLMPQLVTQDR